LIVPKGNLQIAISLLAVALLCGGIGLVVGWRQGVKAAPVFDLFAVAQFSTYVSAVRQTGTDAAYEDALRANLTFDEQAKQRDPDTANHRMYDLDIAITLVRLSEIAGKRGANDEADRFRSRAEAHCPITGIRNCSFAELRRVARFMEGGKLEKRDYE
jgi:hypothetical protein